MFKGSIVALITPFRNGAVDERSFQSFVDWQIKEGTHAVVPCGTTGESPTLSHAEHKRVVEACVEAAKGRVPVIAGTGSNSTEEAIDFTRHAKQAGANAALIVNPYYNKPTQEGLYQHFKAIAESTDLPMILYNVPSRTIADLSNDTVVRLSQVKGIVGIKEATGNIERAQWLLRELPRSFSVYSGDDPTAVALMLCGGHGNVSVTANVAPRAMHELCVAAIAGDARKAMAIQNRLMPLHRHLFVEANPIPVKWAMAKMGLCGPALRLPMTPLTPAFHGQVEAALRSAGVLG